MKPEVEIYVLQHQFQKTRILHIWEANDLFWPCFSFDSHLIKWETLMLFVSISLKMMHYWGSFTLLLVNETKLAILPSPFLILFNIGFGKCWSPLDVQWENFAQMENNLYICCLASGNRFAYFFIIFPHINWLYFSFSILSAFCPQNNPLVN